MLHEQTEVVPDLSEALLAPKRLFFYKVPNIIFLSTVIQYLLLVTGLYILYTFKYILMIMKFSDNIITTIYQISTLSYFIGQFFNAYVWKKWGPIFNVGSTIVLMLITVGIILLG